MKWFWLRASSMEKQESPNDTVVKEDNNTKEYKPFSHYTPKLNIEQLAKNIEEFKIIHISELIECIEEKIREESLKGRNDFYMDLECRNQLDMDKIVYEFKNIGIIIKYDKIANCNNNYRFHIHY